MKKELSVVVPVYNEEKNLIADLAVFQNYLENKKDIEKYEVLVVENGSTDKTLQRAKNFCGKNQNFRLLRVHQRSIGLALKKGILAARFPYIYFNAIDNPFKFKDLESFLKMVPRYDLVFASKNNPDSSYKSHWKRKLASKILSFMVRNFFAVPLTDTQGTFIGKKEKLWKIVKKCYSHGAFFQAEVAIEASRSGLKITEVPVNFVSSGKKSSFSLLADGMVFMGEMMNKLFRNP